MEGGINAWKGLVATGPPEAGMVYFSDKDRPEDIISISWMMEEGALRFYKGVEALMEESVSAGLFRELAAAEVRHKSMLHDLYMNFSASGAEKEFPGHMISQELENVMEGGMRIVEALDWAAGKDIKGILDFSMAMETNSYDLYLRMELRVEEGGLKRIFRALSDEEKTHLERLADMLEESQ